MSNSEVKANKGPSLDEQRNLAEGLANLMELHTVATQKGYNVGHSTCALTVDTVFDGIGFDGLRSARDNTPGLIVSVLSSPAVVPDDQSWGVEFYANGSCTVPNREEPVAWDEGVGETLRYLKNLVRADVDQERIERALAALRIFAE